MSLESVPSHVPEIGYVSAMMDEPTLRLIARLVDSEIDRQNGVTVREVREIPGVEVDALRTTVEQNPALTANGSLSNPDTVVHLDRNAVLAALIDYLNDE